MRDLGKLKELPPRSTSEALSVLEREAILVGMYWELTQNRICAYRWMKRGRLFGGTVRSRNRFGVASEEERQQKLLREFCSRGLIMGSYSFIEQLFKIAATRALGRVLYAGDEVV